LCAGLIGYRALRKAGQAKRIGIYGFGAAAHIVVQRPLRGPEVWAFTRPAMWLPNVSHANRREWGWRNVPPPMMLDAAIIFVGRRARSQALRVERWNSGLWRFT
jgi:propanol-preferring alcohol dehydrogenase